MDNAVPLDARAPAAPGSRPARSDLPYLRTVARPVRSTQRECANLADVRVATFNMLHGLALRQREAADTPDDADPEQGHARVWSPVDNDPVPLAATAQALAELGPIDVMALQEVDRHQPRSGGVDQVAVIAEAIGARVWRFAAALHGTPGVASEGASWVPASAEDDLAENQPDPVNAPDVGPRYGVALLSRWPVRQWKVTRFPPAPVSLPLLAPNAGKPRAVVVPDEPRVALLAVLELPRVDVTVVAAHLSFVPGYNTKQLQSLKAFAAGLPRPLVLMGDFNLPGTLPGLLTGWRQIARISSYPVNRPRVQFDHIIGDGWLEVSAARAQESVRAVPLPVSDHCALIADFPEP